jgi:hypothetical protein
LGPLASIRVSISAAIANRLKPGFRYLVGLIYGGRARV